jgi:hypothetical protein
MTPIGNAKMETNTVKETPKIGEGLAGPGRPKGLPNRSTQIVREAIANLLERNAGNMDRWLNEVAQDDPYKALDLMNKLSEYHIPKLARTEISGVDGAPQQHVVTWQK